MKISKKLALAAYYGLARYLPTQPAPGWRQGYRLRRMRVTSIFDACGDDVIVKRGAYFGDGAGLRVGHRAQIGHDSRIDRSGDIGDDVLMGPDVVIMSVGHANRNPDTPLNRQGALPWRPVRIGRDAWIGTRVVSLPGVEIGGGAVVGASTVITKSVPASAVVAGNPARVVRWRGPVSPGWPAPDAR